MDRVSPLRGPFDAASVATWSEILFGRRCIAPGIQRCEFLGGVSKSDVL